MARHGYRPSTGHKKGKDTFRRPYCQKLTNVYIKDGHLPNCGSGNSDPHCE
jgi:hypothetical protein